MDFFPEAGEGFGDDLGVGDAEAGVAEDGGGEGHGHAVVVVGLDEGGGGCGDAGAVPAEEGGVGGEGEPVAEAGEFGGEGGGAVGFFVPEGFDTGEGEGDAGEATGDGEGLDEVGHVGEVVFQCRYTGGGVAADEEASVVGAGFHAEGLPEGCLPGVALYAVRL